MAQRRRAAAVFVSQTNETRRKTIQGTCSAGNASGAECAYFGRCRVDKNRSRCELRADDPALFAEYQSRRQAEQPPPAGAGVVAVECHGMNLIPMAHRKGWKESAGWVSFVREPARPDAIDKIEFAQNRTGFHVVELGATREAGGGAVRLAPAPGTPRRFNFYKDLAGETRKFAALEVRARRRLRRGSGVWEVSDRGCAAAVLASQSRATRRSRTPRASAARRARRARAA